MLLHLGVTPDVGAFLHRQVSWVLLNHLNLKFSLSPRLQVPSQP